MDPPELTSVEYLRSVAPSNSVRRHIKALRVEIIELRKEIIGLDILYLKRQLLPEESRGGDVDWDLRTTLVAAVAAKRAEEKRYQYLSFCIGMTLFISITLAFTLTFEFLVIVDRERWNRWVLECVLQIHMVFMYHLFLVVFEDELKALTRD